MRRQTFRSSLSRSTLKDNSSSADLADHINIFMGTNNLGPKFSRGNQHPGVHVPFGMNAFSISTKNPSNPWFYQYDEMTITGVKLTHQPSVWARDHASMVFLPSAGQVRQNFLSLKSPYAEKTKLRELTTIKITSIIQELVSNSHPLTGHCTSDSTTTNFKIEPSMFGPRILKL